MTMVDVDTFVAYPYLDTDLRSLDAARRAATPAERRRHAERRPVGRRRRRARPGQGPRPASRRGRPGRRARAVGRRHQLPGRRARRRRRLRPQRHHQHHAPPSRHRGHHHRRQRARPRPRRPPLHDLPHRARGGLIMSPQLARTASFRQGARPHRRRARGTCIELAARAEGGQDGRLPRCAVCTARNIALIFEKTSTRTRCAFEVAAHDQGAHVTYLEPVRLADRPQGVRRRHRPGARADVRRHRVPRASPRRPSRRSPATPACPSGTGSPTSGTPPRCSPTS